MIFSVGVLKGQQSSIHFDHISVEQGLSNFTVTSIAQDKQGFIWIGTEDGLNKFDGYNFTIYRPNPDNPLALPFQYINKIFVDSHERIWLSTSKPGLYYYDPLTDGFKKQELEGQDFVINDIVEDERGNLWLASSSSLACYNLENGRFKTYLSFPRDSSTLSSSSIISLYLDQKKNLWIGCDNGLNLYVPAKDNFIRLSYPHGSKNFHVFKITSDKNDRIWCGTSGGLFYLDPADSVLKKSDLYIKLPPAIILSVFTDSRNYIWIGTMNAGLFRLNPDNGHYEKYLHDPADPYSISVDRTQVVFEDRSGLIWIAPYRQGLDIYNRLLDAFQRFNTASSIYAILQSREGDIYCGSWGKGLQVFDHKSNHFTNYLHDPKNKYSISINGVLALAEDKNNNLWIGTEMGLNLFDKKTKKFYYYPDDQHPPVENDEMKSLYLDGERLWVGTLGRGLMLFDLKKKKYISFYDANDSSLKSLSSQIWFITKDEKGNLWLASFGNGLICFNPVTKSIKQFKNKTGDVHSLSSDALYNLYITRDKIWIGTFGAGLCCMDRNSKTFVHYNVNNGLIDNFVKAIVADGKGNLWLSTDKGLSRFNPGTKTFTNFTSRDGLHNNQFLSDAYFKNSAGEIFFGGENGFTKFDPQKIRRNTIIPPIAITDFRVFNSPLANIKPGYFSGVDSVLPLKLSYDQNFFTFGFSALDYSLSTKNQYAYKLEGLHSRWIYNGTRHYADFTNIDPGRYIFRVKGSNSDGVWNETGISIPLIITPPYWQTWWFRSLVFAFVAAVSFVLYRYRLNSLIKIERLRTRISADLHDEIAGNLSSIAMYGKIIQNEAKNDGVSKISESPMLERLINLSKESVSSIRDIIWALDPRPETLYDLLLRLHDFTSGVCSVANIKLKFDLPEKEKYPDRNLSADQRNNLWLLVKEAVNNCIKHAQASHLEIETFYRRGYLGIKLKDDGRGFDPQKLSSGKGMTTMKSRASALNGDIQIKTEQGDGTEIKMTLYLLKSSTNSFGRLK